MSFWYVAETIYANIIKIIPKNLNRCIDVMFGEEFISKIVDQGLYMYNQNTTNRFL